MRMDLYFSPLACSLATRIALYEAGVSARFIEVDGKSKRTLPDAASFREVNPLGLVPVLRTDSGELLTENAAILQHVADQHPHAALAPASGMARSRLQEWLCFIGTELHKGLFVPLLDKSAPAEVKAWTLAKYRSRLDELERRLAGREYVLDAFSVADAYLVAVLNWSIATSIKLADWPAVAAYHKRLTQRPSIARAIGEELVLYQREQKRNGETPVSVPQTGAA
jgi:glutathione S-transferase